MSTIEDYFKTKYKSSVTAPEETTIDDYFSKKYAKQDPSVAERLMTESTSPVKLSGQTTLSAAPEKTTPLGFLGRATKAAYDTAKDTIESAASRFDELFKSLDNQSQGASGKITDYTGEDYSKPTGETIGMTPEERKVFYENRKKETTPLNRAVNIGKTGLGIANIGFLPVTAQIEAAKQVPILKYPAEGASYVFEKLGALGSYTLGKSIDVLPASDQTKSTIKPLAEELGAFIAQMVGIKVGFKVAEVGGGKLVEKLPISEKAKGRINTGAQVGVGMSMTPFSTAYGYASSRLTAKIHERALENKKITPEEGRKIVEEVKQETQKHVEEMKAETVDETTAKLDRIQQKVDESGRKVEEALNKKQLQEVEVAKAIEDVPIIYPKEQHVKVMSDEGLFLSSGSQKHSFNSSEVKSFAKKIEERIPNPEYIKNSTPEELARIRDSMQSLRNEVKNMEAPVLFERDGDGKRVGTLKQIEASKKIEKLALEKLNKQINQRIDLAEKQASDKLWSEYKIAEGDYPPGSGKKTTIESKPTPKKEIESPEKKEDTQAKSRVYERLQKEYPDELKENVLYDKIKLKEQADKAVELIKNDKEEAYQIAMGAKESTEITQTAVNIAMAETALKNGNLELFNQLTKNRSLAQTRRGQEIVSEKGSVSDNSTARYVKELINAKMSELGNSYLSDVANNPLIGNRRKRSPQQKAGDIINKEVEKAREKTKIKEMDIKQAQSFLDKLACA